MAVGDSLSGSIEDQDSGFGWKIFVTYIVVGWPLCSWQDGPDGDKVLGSALIFWISSLLTFTNPIIGQHKEKEPMEIDIPDESNARGTGIKENGFHLYPVSVHDSGEGLPYAPIDWPNPGDNWSWRVGKRIAVSGNFLDRYLYLPSRFQQSMRKKTGFASKLSVEQYIRAEFPGADIDAFFASFSWKIPSRKPSEIKGNEDELGTIKVLSEKIAEHSGSDSQFGTGGCKAGNKMCSSLVESGPSSEVMVCNICCSEPGFCRNCCCILCCRTVNWNYGGYSFIKCEGMEGEGFICGHIAHIECSLRSYMAGTVGGSIGLDAEYYCRRCDTRTDLVSHVSKLLQTCQSIESQDEIEKILSIGVCVLRGSRKTSAKMLLHRIELAMAKLKRGTYLEDLQKMEDITAVTGGGVSYHENDALGVADYKESLDLRNGSPQILSGNFDHQMESLQLEDEVDRVLHALRKSQETEYKIADERLCAQKKYLLNLYQQLDKEKSELSRHTSSTDPDSLLDAVLKRVNQIKRELVKLKEMEKVARGFGKTSKDILKEHFGLEIEQ